jgi:hypothetical protein
MSTYFFPSFKHRNLGGWCEVKFTKKKKRLCMFNDIKGTKFKHATLRVQFEDNTTLTIADIKECKTTTKQT